METDINLYLNSFLNQSENLTGLIDLYLKYTGCKIGGLFVQDTSKTKYHLLAHIPKQHVRFKPLIVITSILVSNNKENLFGYIAEYEVTNIIIIPIMLYEEVIGVICLGNKDDDISEEIVILLSSLISITQLILSKHKSNNELTQVYSDSNYFSKDLFLANMSHEIRTPLNGVIGYGQLLLQTELQSTQKSYVTNMNQCCLQLMQIINDVLDFTKLASGKMTINNECFSVNEIIEECKDAMGGRFLQKKQQCKYLIEKDTPIFICMDKNKLIQILINLLANANKFTDINGHITITFKRKDSSTLYISVDDDGQGISEQDQCKLFNTFIQLNNAVTNSGTGLGLAISQKLVELLHGQIKVKSAVGVGSCFYFTVKFRPFEEYEKKMVKDVKFLKGKYVLVVDDNADNRIILQDILFKWDMKPVMCASALEAIRLIMNNRYPFELGLIDICMSPISGVQLAKEIKEEKPLFPLIALSSVDSFVDSTNFEYKLNKPINKTQLFSCIYKVLKSNRVNNAYIGDMTDSESPRTSPSNSPISKYNKTAKILIAEDIYYNQTMLVNMLISMGFNNVTAVNDGLEAVKELNNNEYDVLLLDLKMPNMDGYQVMEYVNNSSLSVKIIAVTASVLLEEKNKCKKHGIDYFIVKPIDFKQLKEVMLSVVERD